MGSAVAPRFDPAAAIIGDNFSGIDIFNFSARFVFCSDVAFLLDLDPEGVRIRDSLRAGGAEPLRRAVLER